MKHDALKTFSALKAALEQERAQIQARLDDIQAALGGGEIPTPAAKQEPVWETEPKRGPGRPKGTKGGMSAAGRAAIVAAQKARWAKKNEQKDFTAPQLTVGATLAEPSKPAKKRQYTAEGKARIVAGIKARWARYNAAKGLTASEASKSRPPKSEDKKTLGTTPTPKPVQESKPAKKRKISAAGRAAMVAAGKARWAKGK